MNFTNLLLALAGSAAIGSAAALAIQIGKKLFPQAFPDGTAQNWRLLLVFLSAVLLYFSKPIGLKIDFEAFEDMAKNLADLGVILMPLFIWASDWASQKFYASVLPGVAFVGKSYSPAGKSKG